MAINLSVSAAACVYIQLMIEKNHALGFRLSIKKTGCSGYAYLPEIINAINPNDSVFETPNGLKIYVDTAWLHLLQNITVDYIEENKTGLKQKRLVFINPNETSRCGCGESFHIDEANRVS